MPDVMEKLDAVRRGGRRRLDREVRASSSQAEQVKWAKVIKDGGVKVDG